MSSVASVQTNETIQVNNVDQEKYIEEGNKKLSTKWTIWLHSTSNSSWEESDYEKVDKQIETIADLLHFYNSFDEFNFTDNHVFVMRNGIKPTWEDPVNRNGGICSLKTDLYNKHSPELASAEVFKYMLLRLCGETTHSELDKANTINGLSISPKVYSNTRRITCIVKVWNSDGDSDLSTQMHSEILEKYKDLSFRYKKNEPEK